MGVTRWEGWDPFWGTVVLGMVGQQCWEGFEVNIMWS